MVRFLSIFFLAVKQYFYTILYFIVFFPSECMECASTEGNNVFTPSHEDILTAMTSLATHPEIVQPVSKQLMFCLRQSVTGNFKR